MHIDSSRMLRIMSAGLIAATFAAGTALAQQPTRDTARSQDTTRSYGGKTGADTTRAPRGAHFRCADDTWSNSRNPRTACANHGGIADTLKANNRYRTRSDTGAMRSDNDRDGMRSDTGATRHHRMRSDTGAMGSRSARRNAMEHDSTNATARCKDGTWSHSHRKSGACSRHGGVDRWTNQSGQSPHQ